jgi:hypothetical protein
VLSHDSATTTILSSKHGSVSSEFDRFPLQRLTVPMTRGADLADRMLCCVVDELTSSAFVVASIEQNELFIYLVHLIMERICSLE